MEDSCKRTKTGVKEQRVVILTVRRVEVAQETMHPASPIMCSPTAKHVSPKPPSLTFAQKK